METAVLTTKGELLIPERLRAKYRMAPGAKVTFIESEEGLIIKPVDEDYIDEIVRKVGNCFPTREEFEVWKAEEKALEDRFLNEPGISYKKGKTNKK